MAKITLPLEILEIDPHSYHIFIGCIINGSACDILIDTGASRTIFDMKYISDSNPVEDYDEIISAGLNPGNINTKPGLLKTFSIGGKLWHDVNAMFMDLTHINEVYNRISDKKIAGLMGGDFLRHTKAQLDYGKLTVVFSIPSKLKELFG